MALTTGQKLRAWRWWVAHRASTPDSTACKFTKTQVAAAADAMDTWIDANKAAAAASLAGTAFAGAGSTTDEKLRLFLAVLLAQNDYDLEVG